MTTNQRANRIVRIMFAAMGATLLMAAGAHAKGYDPAPEWWVVCDAGLTAIGIALSDVFDD